jgi:branched-chain amino acid aminotransferase
MMSIAGVNGKIWMDGEFVDAKDAKIHVLTHTFHYGVGAFEGIRAYKTEKGPAIFRLVDHTNRLFNTAKILKMTVPFDKETLLRIQTEIISMNQLEAGYIRPVLYYGDEGLGIHAEKLKTHVMIAAWPWGAYLGAEGLTKGIRVMTSALQRLSTLSGMNKAKANGNYLNSVLALKDAVAAGYDEALFLDSNGYVAEGSGENFFMIKNGELITPPLTAVLEGITRDTVMTLAKDLEIPVREAYFTRDQVYTADEAFFTGTAAEITPIRELDGRDIGDGRPGPLTLRLQKAFFDVVEARDLRYQDWLTYCK